MTCSSIRRIVGTLALAVLVAFGAAAGLMGSPVFTMSPALAQTGGAPPGGSLSGASSAERLWAPIRRGVQGTVTIPDGQAATLVQSDGENWRAFKNGPLSNFGGWLLLAAVVALVLFRLVRGQVKIDSGPAGTTIERFNALERAAHWLTASSFIVLALTGLNLLYGRYVLKPIIGPDAFAFIAYYGKIVHNFISFAFIAGLILMFVLWVKDNLLDKTDFAWIAKGGGLLVKGVHPPAKKFNFGQKCVFWIVILGGASMAWSGLALIFPFEITPWNETFTALNILGFNLPTNLTPLQEVQLSVLWHSASALVMTAVILAHIYIGTPLGMEGAIGAVGQGQVDVNWAKEHHSLWAVEVLGEKAGGTHQPAE